MTLLVTYTDGSTEEYDDVPFTAGTEGAIHLSRDKQSVVKLYHPHPDPKKAVERKDRIEKLIDDFNPTKDDPYWREFFTWPEKHVEKPSIGYRMRFAGKLKTLDNYILANAYSRLKPEEKGWFIGYVATAIKLTGAAARMSSMGLCYPDFSERNVLVEPFEGRMVLIDCDSLTVPDKLAPTVEGTSWYRAPEIITKKVTIPSVRSDRHALAVLLYLWLLRGHPLVGDKVFDPTNSERDDELRFGEKALYIEHPTDHSNWNKQQKVKAASLGPELDRLFRTAFIDGLHNPEKRPLPIQWHEALLRTYDRIIPCASTQCNRRFFVATPTPQLACPYCAAPVQRPQYLPFVYLFAPRYGRPGDFNISKTNAHYIVGWPGRPLHRWHMSANATAIHSDPTQVIDTRPHAVFEYDDQNQQWYIKNLLSSRMTCKRANDPVGTWHQCPINTDIPLENGMTFEFNDQQEHYLAYVEMVKVD